MGYDAESARGLIRLSLGRFNTRQETDEFLRKLHEAVSDISSAEHDAAAENSYLELTPAP